LGLLVLAAALVGAATSTISAADRGERSHSATVTVPEADRFTPYAITIRPGDTVRWVNNDTDGHFVVSDDAFNTTGNRGVDQQLAPGQSLQLRFTKPGTFVYYCRLHARLDAFNQPVAPGPGGGIQDANGNFGTPMTGVVVVQPGNANGNGNGND
jgi:plastocyanin